MMRPDFGPEVVRSRDALRARVAGWRAAGAVVGVVPTMGALHPGHLSLIEAAQRDCDRVIVTLFVNPTQFNTPTDLDSYPRTEDRDRETLAPLAVDLLYAPDVAQVYPAGFATTVSVAGVPDVLCGAHRPGHFDGVATVVAKLFSQTGADRAYFGEKDFQQVQVVRRMARDLDLPVEIVACPTLREADGLAMSSRNLRLSGVGRAIAPALYREMQAMARGLRQGGRMTELRATATARLLAAGVERVEYLDLRCARDLTELEVLHGDARLFVAGWVEGVRLIDNIAV